MLPKRTLDDYKTIGEIKFDGTINKFEVLENRSNSKRYLKKTMDSIGNAVIESFSMGLYRLFVDNHPDNQWVLDRQNQICYLI